MQLTIAMIDHIFTTGNTASAIIAAIHAGPDLNSTTQTKFVISQAVLLVWG